MVIMMKRQLSESDKETILEKYGRICYANGHIIPDESEIHFDHIKAYSSGGATDLKSTAT